MGWMLQQRHHDLRLQGGSVRVRRNPRVPRRVHPLSVRRLRRRRRGCDGVRVHVSLTMLLPFTVRAVDGESRARRGTLVTAHGPIETPAFMAVGTRASVTGFSPADLAEIGAQ